VERATLGGEEVVMTRDATTCGHLGPACVLCGFCHACHTCHTALQPGVRPAPGWVVLYLAGLWIAFGVVLFAAVWAVSAWGGEATLEQRVQAPPGSSVELSGRVRLKEPFRGRPEEAGPCLTGIYTGPVAAAPPLVDVPAWDPLCPRLRLAWALLLLLESGALRLPPGVAP